MQRERRRAALAALCVFAVALAASLFPAGGFGAQPAGVGTGGGPDAPPGGTATDPTRPTDESPGSTTSTGAETDDTSTETTTTTTTTTTETETTTAAAADTGDGPDLGAVLGVLFGVGVAVLAVGFRLGEVGVTTDTAGGLPFTVTVRGTPIGSLVGALPARTMEVVVGLSASVPRLLDDAAALSRAVGDGLATALGAAAAGAGSALRIGARGLGATIAAVPRALAGLGAGASVLSGVGLPSIGGRDRSRETTGRGSTPDADPADPAPPSVEEAWRAMTERVRVRNRDARTPGEFARAAVERGYPDEAVRRLTDAFREVRYGSLPREERTSAARAALDALRRHWEDDDE